MRLADGVLLVVDVLEGVGAATERAVQQAVAEGLAITLVISKVRVRCGASMRCCSMVCGARSAASGAWEACGYRHQHHATVCLSLRVTWCDVV
jgi:hypothetical protein